jgi:predicted outer membrane repeat protein
MAYLGGGAIRNSGILTLESCIFSGNKNVSSGTNGGAITSSNTLTIRGCTFYGNTSTYRGGAVYFYGSGKNLALEGNLFYGNIAGNSYPVVNRASGTVSALYNVVDVALGTGSDQSGWAPGPGDVFSTVAVSPGTFKVPSGSPAAGNLPGTLPEGYPTVDFYGQPINGGGAAGAIQAVTVGASYLGLSVNHSQRGSASMDATPNEDGLFSNGTSITVTAVPSSGAFIFKHWLVDGVVASTSNPYTLTISAHIQVQAVFDLSPLTVFIDEAGSETVSGTLRWALTNAQDGDTIIFNDVTPGTTVIELQSALPELTKSVTIEGNGVTLTRAASWTSSDSQLLYIPNGAAEVAIRRVHFKNGFAGAGGAIRNSGILTLESCIFSGNEAGSGGAVYSNNTLTIRGCTFYGNISSDRGGAVYFYTYSAALTLEGNLFYGNTAALYYPVALIVSSGTVASYNVIDTGYNSSSGASWSAGTGDTTFTALGISGTPFNTTSFAPVSALQSVLSSAPTDFPETDFNGNTRTFPGAPGAVR